MSMEPLPNPVLISNQAALADAAALLGRRGYFSVDTEFVRTDTFYANLGLIQMSDGVHCWLVDPLACGDLSPVVALLENPAIIKIFHSSSEDLEVLQTSLRCMPQAIFDTQVAAALSGYGFTRGYAGLIDELLSVSLAKHETRSDWLQRPLSESQLHYAAEDVYYLVYLYRQLSAQLDRLQRHSWMEEEMARLLETAAIAAPTENYYLKVKGAWKLDRRSLGMLQLLCDWREREARAKNRPRKRIVDDKSLLEIAMNKPGSAAQIASATGVRPSTLRRYAWELCRLVEQGQGLDADALPARLPKPVPREAGAILKQLKQLVANRAEQLDIPVELLAKKADLEQALRSAMHQSPFPERLSNGWRDGVVGQSIRDMLGVN